MWSASSDSMIRRAGVSEAAVHELRGAVKELEAAAEAREAAMARTAKELEATGEQVAVLQAKLAALEARPTQHITANPLMLSMVASVFEFRQGLEMPSHVSELYQLASEAMLERGGAATPQLTQLLHRIFFEAHVAEQRIVTLAHVEAAAARLGADGAAATGELVALVRADQLPLVRLIESEPLQMQAFHLSFQEFYAMRAVSAGGARLPGFRWSAWWTNAVLMGVQVGDAFGAAYPPPPRGSEKAWLAMRPDCFGDTVAVAY